MSCCSHGAFAQVGGVTDNRQTTTLNKRLTVSAIHVYGNKRTKRKIILREMSVEEGSEVSADSLENLLVENKQRLFNLGLFTDVAVTADTIDSSRIDLHVKLKEQWYILPEVSFKLADRNFNVWWKEHNHDIRRINAGVSLRHRNFRGNAEILSATVQVGYTQKLGLEYFKPYIDKDQKHGLGASFSISKNEETYYITDSNKLLFIRTPGSYVVRQFEATGVYVYRPAYSSKHLVELKYRDMEVSDTVVALNPDYFENGSNRIELFQLTYRFDYNKVDNWNYPLRGGKAVTTFISRYGIKGFRFQAALMAELGYFKNLHGKWYSSNIFRGRLTLPEDQAYYFRSALGVDNEYVRGYEYYVIDGSQYGLIRNNLKYELVNFRLQNIPLRYLPVIPIRIYPKVYVDAGYAKNRYPFNSFLNNRLLYSAGLGFDLITAYDFKFRFEYTWNQLGQKGLFLHLNSE